MDYCIETIEELLKDKLFEAVLHFGSKELKKVDIGVFPWHSTIELSLYFTENSADINDVASWPNFNFSKMSEGGWPEGKELAIIMNQEWEETTDAIPYFLDFGTAASSDKVKETLEMFNLANDFKIQVLNPDERNSENYCA